MSIPKDAPEQQGLFDDPVPAKPDLPGDDGSYQVASVSSAITRCATRAVTEEIMKPLTRPGARVSDEVEIVAPTTKPEEPAPEPV